jgi:hypothetical protein
MREEEKRKERRGQWKHSVEEEEEEMEAIMGHEWMPPDVLLESESEAQGGVKKGYEEGMTQTLT